MKNKFNHNILTYLWVLLLISAGCKKSIEVDLPINKFTAEKVYSSTRSSVAVLNGIYTELGRGSGFAGVTGPSYICSALADELETNNTIIYPNNYTVESPGLVNAIWESYYRVIIYRVNSFIEGVSASTGIPDEDKNILLGEAKFIRALCYFHLVNLWGDVPLITGTDFKVNSSKARSPQTEVYDQIIKDLLDAQVGLKDDFLDIDLSSTTTERVRPNKAAATALLARVYLYKKDWANAELEATKLLEQNTIYDTVPLQEVFLKNSRETIWSLQPTGSTADEADVNTKEGDLFLRPYDNPPTENATLSSYLLNEFEVNDNRKLIWTTTVSDYAANIFIVPYKYKAGITVPDQLEFTIVLRIAEQYLIRAEARTHLENVEGAKSDLNVIRMRAGLPNTTANTIDELLAAVAHERYVELFTEFGHRWFDLKRTDKINARMEMVTPSKGGVWQPYKAWMPIRIFEMNNNPSLVQTPGY